MKQLDLFPGAEPCVRSGYCCSRAPCGFGEATPEGPCKYLHGKGPGKYECLIAEQISRDPTSKISPAFGAGCCSSMNPVRIAMKRDRDREREI